MEIIHLLAECFNSTAFHILLLLHKFLKLNFQFVSFVINNAKTAKDTISEYIISTLNICCCYYQDFVIFLYEVIEITRFSIDTILNFLQKLLSSIVYVISHFIKVIYVIRQSIAQLITEIQLYILKIYETTTYLLQLLFNSVLLILQLGPNLLILLYEISVEAVCYLFTCVHDNVLLLFETICYGFTELGDVVFSIPVKAYLGALLLAMLFYKHKVAVSYLKAYFIILFLILFKLGNYFVTVVCVCLKSVASVTASARKTLKSFYTSNEEMVRSNSEANSSDFNEEMHSQSTQSNTFLRNCSITVRSLLRKYSLRRRHAEEQIEQLQKELTAERDKHTCIICFDRPRSMIIYPCRHMCICEECSANWFTELQRCPLCRRTVLDVFHVFT